MWKQILEFARDIFLLQRDMQQNKDEIKECKQELKEARRETKELQTEFNKLLLLVQKLNSDVQHVAEKEEGERAQIKLELENALLKFERRLPSGENK